MASVTFLFPHPAAGPTGGYQVVYEYANRLAADGHKVTVVYSGSIFWRQKDLFHKMTNIVRYGQQLLKGYSSRKWFPLDGRVREVYTFSLNYRHVPKSDRYVATSPFTAFYLNRYPVDTARKYYFIQDREDWSPRLKVLLPETYHYPMSKITISLWLLQMLRDEFAETAVLIPNGFDFNKFSLTVPISEKDRFRISMLYHTMERKDCAMGFRALQKVKERYPQLRVSLFGASTRPDGLPEWYDYYQRPENVLHNRINNQAALYIGTSRQEGLGLTVGEAMICGQAVCCTDNGGYREMATDGETALISPVGDSDALARNIIRLLADDSLRRSIAAGGNRFIRQFTWERSYEKMKNVLNLV